MIHLHVWGYPFHKRKAGVKIYLRGYHHKTFLLWFFIIDIFISLISGFIVLIRSGVLKQKKNNLREIFFQSLFWCCWRSKTFPKNKKKKKTKKKKSKGIGHWCKPRNLAIVVTMLVFEVSCQGECIHFLFKGNDNRCNFIYWVELYHVGGARLALSC